MPTSFCVISPASHQSCFSRSGYSSSGGSAPRSLVLADLTVAEIVFALQGVYERPR
jgi:hypothetical protein